MANATQKLKLSPSRDVLFNKLVLSQSNVRCVKAGVSIEQLAQGTAQRTLRQSLNVRAVLYGLFGEIISRELRLFVPVGATGPAILAKARYPIARIADRAGA